MSWRLIYFLSKRFGGLKTGLATLICQRHNKRCGMLTHSWWWRRLTCRKRKKLFGEKGNHPFTCLYCCFADNMGLVNDVINKKKVLTTKYVFIDLNSTSLFALGVSILTTLSFRKYVSFDWGVWGLLINCP